MCYTRAAWQSAFIRTVLWKSLFCLWLFIRLRWGALNYKKTKVNPYGIQRHHLRFCLLAMRSQFALLYISIIHVTEFGWNNQVVCQQTRFDIIVHDDYEPSKQSQTSNKNWKHGSFETITPIPAHLRCELKYKQLSSHFYYAGIKDGFQKSKMTSEQACTLDSKTYNTRYLIKLRYTTWARWPRKREKTKETGRLIM